MFDLNYNGAAGDGGQEKDKEESEEDPKKVTEATVKSIKVRKGGWIAKGQVVIIVKETMKDSSDKMHKIKTEAEGKVEEIHVSVGETIEKGSVTSESQSIIF